jgi:MinD-like ATPase involved in chromosome partitioning or flagellar assembly
MRSITFFSYKGGVGRTLAATNFAVYLAKLGLRVVIMDFDLDAPGVDSKFPNFSLPKNQRGLIDYILEFQREGKEPGPVSEILCSVPIDSPRQQYSLSIIPAGDYLATDYSAKLNELNWNLIFSPERDGVAFFQVFLERIKSELSPDVLVIDSRTGFSEISGLCTQQLADETVILSSLASESVKMTRHLAQMIRESEIAKQLKKEVETKVVVCRLPKPTNVDKLKAECCKRFGVDETKLFFLFSCSGLERDEFVAMLETQKEPSLVASYVQLFQGLKLDVAQESIKEEIERTEKGLLSFSPQEAESRIREMVALFPHPEVYRRAMRFFELTRHREEASAFALRLLDLVPDDVEAQVQVAHFILQNDVSVRHALFGRPNARLSDGTDPRHLVAIAERVYVAGKLSKQQKVRLADLLEDLGEHAKSFQIAKMCLESEEIEDPELRATAMAIAARTAMKLGKKDEATKLVSGIPIGRLGHGLASVAIDLKLDAGDKEGAFDVAKTILMRDLVPEIIGTAVKLANDLGRRSEFEELLRMHPEFETVAMHPEIIWELERSGFDVSELRERSRVLRRGRHRH